MLPSGSNNKYRADIDGLRAIAVLSVVFFHAFPKLLPGGYIGVDVFFVISGYLITGIIYGEMQKNTFCLKQFYIRRIKRIFPALIFFLCCLFIFSYGTFFYQEFDNLAKHVMASGFFLNNFLLWKEAGYFDKSSELKPLLHLWSLGIEEQFYLVWPFVLLLTIRTKQKFPYIMMLIVIGSFLLNLLRVKHHAVAAFYLPFTRIWELGIGGLLAYFIIEKPNFSFHFFQKNKSTSFLNYAVTFAFVVCLFVFNQTMLYPSWYAIVPVSFCCLLILFPSAINEKILSHRLLVSIGLISYPLYLWHWGIISSAKILFGSSLKSEYLFLLVILSFFAAYFTYRYIEIPIRQKHFFKNDQRLVLILLMMMGILIASGSITYFNHGFKSREINKISIKMLADINDFDKYKKDAYPCSYASELSDTTVCLQSKKQKPQIAIWGDSHAEHLYPGIVKIDKMHSWVLLEKSACPPLLGVEAYWKGAKDSCQKFNNSVLAVLTEHPEIHTVYVSSLGLFYLGESYAIEHQGRYVPNNFILHSPDQLELTKVETFRQGLEKTILALQKLGKRVVLVDDIPALPFMPDTCIVRNIPWFNQKVCQLSVEEKNITAQNKYTKLLKDIQSKYPGIEIVDLKKKFCDAKKCQYRINQHLIMRDSHHLSLYGSNLVATQLLKTLV